MATIRKLVACPKCGAQSSNLEFGQEIQFEALDRPITCAACGHAFNGKDELRRIAIAEAREAFARRRERGR